MLLPKKQREELTKLRVLNCLSHPPFEEAIRAGMSMGEIESALYKMFVEEPDGIAGRAKREQGAYLWRVVPEMKEAGLIVQQEVPDVERRKPYFITDKGRQYLEDAQQRAFAFEPSERQGWAEGVGINKHQAIAGFIGLLPEFRNSGEERIQEVSTALAEAIALPAPQTARRDAGRSGR